MTYIMSCVWLDYMVKYFQCKNCVGSSPKTKKCVASFLVPVYNGKLPPPIIGWQQQKSEPYHTSAGLGFIFIHRTKNPIRIR